MARKALILDDSVTMRKMVGLTLQQAGFEIFEAENGQEGLENLKTRTPDLVVCDVHMPVMDGISFVREMRGKEGFKFIPVLMLTTESLRTKIEEGRAAGATGWIVKPFSPKKLMDAVQRVLP